jgi:hypothetical protein
LLIQGITTGAGGSRHSRNVRRQTHTSSPAGIRPSGRVIEYKNSTEIGSCVFEYTVNAHKDARRRTRRFNVGRLLVLNNPPRRRRRRRRRSRRRRRRKRRRGRRRRRRRWRRRRRTRTRIFSVGRVLVLNSPPAEDLPPLDFPAAILLGPLRANLAAGAYTRSLFSST